MSSAKDTFEANTWEGNTFAAGTFRGLGVDATFAARLSWTSPQNKAHWTSPENKAHWTSKDE